MTLIDCPWCDAPLPVDTADELRCDACSIAVAISPDAGPLMELAAAA